MSKKNCSYHEIKKNEMTIIWEFSEKSEKEECIKNEIKNILTSVLQQYLQ